MTGWGTSGRASWVNPAVQVSENAARKAGVDIRHLDDLSELSEAEALFERIWGPGGVTVPLLRNVSLSGNYVAGAWAYDHLMGVSVSFVSTETEPRSVHHYITGIAPGAQGSGIGFALMCHQRAWALGMGIEEMTWLFDPLVRRNGWFATVKLGAICDAYYPDLFGYLNDPINRWDFTDRCRARWSLLSTEPGEVPPADVADPDIDSKALPALTEGRDGEPVLAPFEWLDRVPELLLCQVPADVHALRQSDPKLAREWLAALRGTLARAIEAGYVVTSMTTGGHYLLSRPD